MTGRRTTGDSGAVTGKSLGRGAQALPTFTPGRATSAATSIGDRLSFDLISHLEFEVPLAMPGTVPG
jgi:hypothetical protein